MGKLKGISLLILALALPSLASAKVANFCGFRLLWGAPATIEEVDLLFPADQTANRLDWNQISKALRKSNFAVRAHILIKMKTLGAWPAEMNSVVGGISARSEEDLKLLLDTNQTMLTSLINELAPYIKEFEGEGSHRTQYGLRHLVAMRQREELLKQKQRDLQAEMVFVRVRQALFGQTPSAI